MSSEEFRLYGGLELRKECFDWLDNRLRKIRKFHNECLRVKRPPTEEDMRKMKSIVAGIRSNYDLVSGVLRLLGELKVISEVELNKYLYYLSECELYVDVI